MTNKVFIKLISLVSASIILLATASCTPENNPSVTVSETQMVSESETVTETTVESESESESIPELEGIVIDINGQQIPLETKTVFGQLVYCTNSSDFEISTLGNYRSIKCPSADGKTLFEIRIYIYKGKGVDDALDGNPYELTEKTVGGAKYKDFCYEDGNYHGHTYAREWLGDTYTINFISEYDMTSLESVFLENALFKDK